MTTTRSRPYRLLAAMAVTVLAATGLATAVLPAGAAPTRTAAAPTAQQVLDGMTLAEKVGQLFMVDSASTGPDSATQQAIQHYHVGSVILDGVTNQGIATTRDVTNRLQSFAPSDAKLLISTDQEGGEVQRLHGRGFSKMPTALFDGTQSLRWVRGHAREWGSQLRAAGVNVNLAPVLDTVPPGDTDNPPIGYYDREFGHYAERTSSKGTAYALGMQTAGVDPVIKHFPGLGRVTGNTDTTYGVADGTSTRHGAYAQVFAHAIGAGVPMVMVSSAIYSQIDPGTPAAFSHTVVTDMLRGDMHFDGVVVSDSLLTASFNGVPLGSRAVTFVYAGGDLALLTSPSAVATMSNAVFTRARNYPYFARLVDAAALHVLQAKRAAGLLH